jgi:hypothetical protein
MLETLSLLVHADSKVGKTTLAATAPLPILALDAEGGWKFLSLRQIEWIPMQGPPPAYDGTWDVCHVTVRDWQTLLYAYQWLQYGQHGFRSIVLDSISECQRRLKFNLVGMEAPRIQHWGEILNQMDAMIRGMRDLTQHPTNPVQVVVFIAETRQNTNGKWVPYLQGQISISLPYWVDLCGYLFTQDVGDPNGQATGELVRRLLIAPNAQFEAGERVQGRLGGMVDSPNLSEMLMRVYPQLNNGSTPQPQQT